MCSICVQSTLDVMREIAIYLHHVIQTVEDVLPGLLGLDAHLHFMLCWGLEKRKNHYVPKRFLINIK